MKQQTIQNIMNFMMRVQLSGQEVPAFNDAMQNLQLELEKLEQEKQED